MELHHLASALFSLFYITVNFQTILDKKERIAHNRLGLKVGDIYIIGEQHTEAAEYFNQKIAECKTKGTEINLHFEIEGNFNVALCNKQ